MIAEALRYSKELGLTLRLANPEPTVCEADGQGGDGDKGKAYVYQKTHRCSWQNLRD